jgi:glycosyltransferase involved in cell wall biosynthesis
MNRDNRISVINKENGGVSSARNTGLDIAKGDYILFIDSDDYISSLYLENVFETIKKNKPDMVINNSWYQITGSSITLQKIDFNISVNFSHVSNHLLLHYIKSHDWASPWGKLYKREIIMENNIRFCEELPIGEDYIFNLHYLCYVNLAVCLDKPMYYYRKYSESATNKVYDNWVNIYKTIYDLKRKIIKDNLLDTNENLVLADKYMSFILYGNIRKEIKLLKGKSKHEQNKRIHYLLNSQVIKKHLNFYPETGFTGYIIFFAFKKNKVIGLAIIKIISFLELLISFKKRT